MRSVVTIHGLDHRRDKWGALPKLCLGLAERTLMASAHEVTVVSEPLRRYFLERYDARTAMIPNGQPKKQPVGAGPVLAELGLVARGYVLFASRLVPEKGCHDLLAAADALPPGMKLVIAGGNGSAEYIARLRAAADPDRVVFAGHRAGDGLAELFSNAALFVLPSYIEGMSMALLEALAYGLPVLVSDIAENRAVVGDAAPGFPARDVVALRAALARHFTVPVTGDAVAPVMAHPVMAHPAVVHPAVVHPGWEELALQYDALYRRVGGQASRSGKPVAESEPGLHRGARTHSAAQPSRI